MAISAVLLAGCGHRSTEGGRASRAGPGLELPADRAADDAARFLAGLPGKPGSPYRPWESDGSWKKHAAALDLAWTRMERENLRGMRAFQRKELSDNSIARSALFYPFSGPDALTLSTLFPGNRLFIMVGLEPAGTLPPPVRLTRQPLAAEFSGVRETLGSVLRRSFFITRQMDRQFRGQISDGLLPAILELLVRTRHTVIGFRYVRLDNDGNVVERAALYRPSGKIGNKGVEIDFRSDSDRQRRKLYYFSVNLADKRLKENRAFLWFLARQGGLTTFLKSTSYMPHQDGFSLIRERILELSNTVVQDDSGLPFHFFDSRHWRVELYGQYERPYGSFKWLQQADLRTAYQNRGSKPMRFRIGYGYAKAPSNLLVARRTKAR